MTTSLIARQIPAFVNDAIGKVGFGPKVMAHSDELINFNGTELTLEEAMRRGADNAEIQHATLLLINNLRVSDPYVFFKRKNGILNRIWNAMTGSQEAREIEFQMNCRRVDKLVAQAPSILEKARDSAGVLLALEQLYDRDIATLTDFIQEGRNYINHQRSGDFVLSDQEEYGLNRLEQRIVNLEVTKASLEMSRVQVGMVLHSTSLIFDVLKECIESAIPVWNHQIKQLRSGAAISNIDPETEARFRTLVNKLNANTKKGK